MESLLEHALESRGSTRPTRLPDGRSPTSLLSQPSLSGATPPGAHRRCALLITDDVLLTGVLQGETGSNVARNFTV